MKKANQLRILNRIAMLRCPVKNDGTPNIDPYRLSSQGKLEYRRRADGQWKTMVGETIEDAIHQELSRAERWGIHCN